MGYAQKRVGRAGKPRYTAVYHDARGERRSAGTFSSKKDADKAWQKAELRLAEGRLGDPRRGRQAFRRYVTEEWLPHHVIEVTTREAYTYQLNKHIMPWFGPIRRMNRQHASAHPDRGAIGHRRLPPAMSEHGNRLQPVLTSWSPGPGVTVNHDEAQQPGASGVIDGCATGPTVSDESALLKDAALICNTAAARGERLTQRALARTLRDRGHRFPNQSLRTIALAVGLGHPPGQLPADGGSGS